MTISDDGHGLETGGSTHEGLGLQIVRTLVTSELAGTIEWLPRDGGGTTVHLRVGLGPEIH